MFIRTAVDANRQCQLETIAYYVVSVQYMRVALKSNVIHMSWKAHGSTVDD